MGVGSYDAVSHQTMPDSPEGYAHSDTSGAGEGGMVGLDHKGMNSRCEPSIACRWLKALLMSDA
jgi:hypothetical protein